MLWITRKESRETVLPPIHFVDDSFYAEIIANPETRIALLDALNLDHTIVGRLGEKVDEDKFVLKKIKISLPAVEDDKEVGYYGKI